MPVFLWQTRALFFSLSLPSSSPTFTLELLREFWRLAGARGKAVVRVVAADRAGNGGLERGVRGTFLGFRHDSRFFRSLIAFLRKCVCKYRGLSLPSVVVRRLFRNASLVGYPRFFVSQTRVLAVLGVLSQYLCCTVEVCVVFLDTLTPEFELYVRLRERRQWDSDFPEFFVSFVTRGRGLTSSRCALVLAQLWLSYGSGRRLLALTLGRLFGVSVQTWTPTLTSASSDLDANFSDLHALQSQKTREQGMATIGGMSPNGSQAV
ncbi:hypothetical protein Taro_029360 [Colocasia esculenta]|uniref:Uncharacterized protein n=1 Tax=Colocasia esculenta TaxID=4460 RepID=A0A843VDM3_COLES|nr:hypothetical protein [Colocasia esculenta]